MTVFSSLLNARPARAVFILGFSLVTTLSGFALGVHAQTAPAPASTPSPTPSSTRAATATKSQTTGRPLWVELTPAQQQALAPLAPEWDKMDAFRKKKWLAIGNKYASMKPDEQQRLQARMRDWIKLTPEQRRIARENYARAKKLNRDQKSAHWEEYKQLPDEQKKKLAADAASRKRVATLPSPASQGKNSKTLPPIKSAPKPVLEQSVTPKAASRSAIQSSAQPAKP
ncbi:DUF3106 domain-containing protein [Noviherbaspirillum sp.]|uniref:DUF3106 domain-containing protein n=1 Tax=Noviherbaspirillum sp. TaxID=1926288 RepID=UPI002B4921E2|nr:DUF3106 domain-containing protein [Noviherbaspirillum sp.]HJV83148.1 DUF3106 domain-containing protein [Noviherbaspirillum sp.]